MQKPICFDVGLIIIYDIPRLIQLLPQYFSFTKYDSFRRCSNRHGFQRHNDHLVQQKYCTLNEALSDCASMVYHYAGPSESTLLLALQEMKRPCSAHQILSAKEHDHNLVRMEQKIDSGTDAVSRSLAMIATGLLELRECQNSFPGRAADPK